MSQDSDNVKLGFNPNNKRCVHVDTGIRLFNDGTTMFCCQSNEQLTTKDGTIGNIQKHTIQEIREGKKAKEIKQALEDGFEHPNCSKCWNEEASGMKSKRLRDNQENPDLIESVELKNMEINLGYGVKNIINKCTHLEDLEMNLFLPWRKKSTTNGWVNLVNHIMMNLKYGKN